MAKTNCTENYIQAGKPHKFVNGNLPILLCKMPKPIGHYGRISELYYRLRRCRRSFRQLFYTTDRCQVDLIKSDWAEKYRYWKVRPFLGLNVALWMNFFGIKCGRGGIGRRAALRSLWGNTRGSSSLLGRTITLRISGVTHWSVSNIMLTGYVE